MKKLLFLVFCISLLMLNSCVSRKPTYRAWDSNKTKAFKAISRNDYLTFSRMIKKGLDVNSMDKRGNTLLSVAVRRNRLGMIKLLLDKKVDVNLFKAKGKYLSDPALHKIESLTACKLLLDAGADPNLPGYAKRTPLMNILSSWARYDMVKMLLDNGADPNIVDYNGNTALHYALRGSSYSKSAILKLLLEYGAKVNVLNREGVSPLHLAAGSRYGFGNMYAVKILLQAGADPNLYNKKKRFGGMQTPPLFSAIEYANFETIKLLVKHGANVNEACVIRYSGLIPGEGYPIVTPLSTAIRFRKFLIVELLLENHVKVTEWQRTDIPAIKPPPPLKDLSLFKFLYVGNDFVRYELFRRAIEAGADVNEVKDNHAILEELVEDIDLLNLLLKHGAKAKDAALRRACEIDNIDAIRLLLKYKADPNARNTLYPHLWDSSPTAVFFVKSISALNLLVEAGADFNYLNDHGKSMLEKSSSQDKDPLFIKAAVDAGSWLRIRR